MTTTFHSKVRIFALTVVLFVTAAAGTPAHAAPAPALAHARGAVRCVDLFRQAPAGLTLKQKVSLWLTTASITMMPFAAFAGGDMGGTGGGGIAGFTDPADQALADSYRKHKRVLPPELLARQEVHLLDRWEMIRNGIEPFDHSPNDDWRSLLARAKANLRLVSPIVANRLEKIEEWMPFEEWQPWSQLPHLKDATPNQDILPGDVPVQIALRFSSGNSQLGEGPALNKVELHVVYDLELFHRLEPLEKAMLVMHEQLYALGQASGHNQSDEVRPLVNIAFSKHFETDVRQRTENGIIAIDIVRFVKQKMVKALGDYVLYFSDSEKLARGEPRSPERHYSVFLENLRSMSESTRRCLQAGLPKPVCILGAQFEFGSRATTTPEAAFMYAVYFKLEAEHGTINAEALMDKTISHAEYEKAMRLACDKLKALEPGFDPAWKVYPIALTYCR